jgi:SNF2 family DNA or RNA helicase
MGLTRLRATDKKLYLNTEFVKKDDAKTIPGSQWSKSSRAWTYPLDRKVFEQILAKFPDAEVDPSVKEKLRAKEFSLQHYEWLKKTHFKADEKNNEFINGQFYRHQNMTFNWFRHMNICADFSDAGAGKTLVQIALIKERIKRNVINKILIICPLSIMEAVWEHDIEKFMKTDNFNYPVHILKDVAKSKKLLKFRALGIYIINYEKVWRIYDELKKMNFDFIILDESSKIKNHSSKQTKACLKLGENVPYKSIMTGTPAPNSYLELWSQIRFLDERILCSNFSSFRNLYFYPGGFENHEWFIRQGAKEHIYSLIHNISVSWKKKDCLDLPDLTIQDIKFQLPKEQQKIYEDMYNFMIAELESGESFSTNIVLTKLLRLSMITSGFIQDTGGERFEVFQKNEKMNVMDELIEEIPTNKKILIWGIFHHDIEMIKNHLTKKYGERSVVTFYGKDSSAQKTENYNQFKTDPECRFFVAHPKSAGMGLNLSNANYSIFYSMNYSYESYAQSKERYNRTGQIENMTEYRLIAKGTIDEIVFRALNLKQSINDYIRNMGIKFNEK